jgi:flagellar biosynthesis chaperone FliJ
MKKLLLSAILLLSSFALNAQNVDDFIEALKTNIKTERKAIIMESMKFTESESKAFWPIYNEFELEIDKLSAKRIKNIKDYADNYEKMTGEKANELIQNAFKFQKERLSLNESYYKKYAKALPVTTAAKYMQLENQIQMLIDLKIASELPLVKKPAGGPNK